MSTTSEPLVRVRDAQVRFGASGGTVRALDGVSLSVQAGETLAVVGESGCGKTTLARAILGLQPLHSGEISVLEQPVEGVSRGLAQRVGIVWQDPYASLDPKWRVGRSVAEPLQLARRSRDLKAIFNDVGLDDRFIERFPHELSGGQRQRVAIGRALALLPPLVICDEPTAALDLSVQAQILNLLRDLQEEHRCAYLYISHDLLTVRFLADRVAVMYLGRIVEEGPTDAIFENPQHPYTRALLDSAPSTANIGRLPDEPVGELPDPRTEFHACRFASRCPRAQPKCRIEDPISRPVERSTVQCHYPLVIPSEELPSKER